MSKLSLIVLGSFQVNLGDKLVSDFRTNKVRALLSYLALETEPHQREDLLSFLWPGLPLSSAQANLRQIVYYLRKAIPEVESKGDSDGPVSLVIANRRSLRLNPTADVRIDAVIFESLLSEIHEHKHGDLSTCLFCSDHLEEAVELYGGEFISDIYLDDSTSFEEWVQRKRDRFRRRALDALDILSTIYLQRNDLSKAMAFTEQQLDIDNLREAAYRRLMEILALMGRRSEAEEVYESCRRVLADALAMAPSRRTSEIYSQIISGEISIDKNIARRVQGYEIHEEIGRGAFGTVHRATQPTIRREVAIKIIHPRYADDPEFIRRFEVEAQTIAQLEHPHILPLYDYWRSPEGAYLVMRYLKGGSLLDALEQGPWELESTSRMLDQVTSALEIAHRHGIVHRDIKPANILLDADGNCYLSDFGIAKNLTRESHLTLDHALVGTPEYFSPEQIREDRLSVQSDIYSLGLVLYETLTGEKPFGDDSSIINLIHSHLNKKVPLVVGSRPDLPATIDEVIQRATAKQPSDRYSSAKELAKAFRYVSKGRQPELPTIIPATPVVDEIYNPYKGLRAFRESDADDFFGRDALVEQLLARMMSIENAVSFSSGVSSNGRRERFLALVGPSGSGKSSAVRAGLVPALRAGALPNSENWFIATMVPGGHPLEELELALWPVAVDSPPSLVEPMERDTRGLLRTIRRILPDEPEAQLVLLIDQFEELFTLVEDEEQRRFFIDSLVTAVTAVRSPLWVIVTLRADFYDRPLQQPRLGQIMKSNTEIVLPLNAMELEWAIREPARRMGVTIAPVLVEKIIGDVSDQPGMLPLLQYALTELFDSRQDGTIVSDTYNEIGGVAGALVRRAETIYGELDDYGKAAAQQIFLRLVTVGEGTSDSGLSPDTRRRVLRTELEALAASQMKRTAGSHKVPLPNPKSSLYEVLDKYGRARLLTFDRDSTTREATVEVAHEALLREWPRFRGWLDNSRADIRMQRLLAQAAAEWQQSGVDPGFLLRDARLDQFSGWESSSTVAVTEVEAKYLEASLNARAARERDEEARLQRELETASKLAVTEKARAESEKARAEEAALTAGRLRRRAFMLSGALVIAAVLAAAAFFFARQSNRSEAIARESADLAITREEEAQAEAQQRATAEVLALSQVATAEVAQAEAQNQQNLAEEAAVEAQSQSRLAEEQAKLASSRELAAAAINNLDVDPELSVLLSLQALTIGDTLEARNALYKSVPELRLLRTITGHQVPVLDIDVDREGTILAASDTNDDARVWDISSGQELHAFTGIHSYEMSYGHRGVAMDQNGTILAFTSSAIFNEVDSVIFDIGADRVIQNLGQPGLHFINDLAISPNGLLLARAMSDGTIDVLDIASGEEVFNFDGHLVSASGNLSAGSNYTKHAASHRTGALKVAFNQDSTLVASGGTDGMANIWDLTTGRLLAEIEEPDNHINGLAFNPEGNRLVTAGEDGTIRVWDLLPDSGEPYASPTIFVNYPVASAEFSPDGTMIATGGSDGVARLWDATSGRELMNLEGHEGAITNAIFTPDGLRLITASEDATIKIWSIAPDIDLLTLRGDGSSMETVQYSPDGKHLAAMSENGTLTVWDAREGKKELEIPGDDTYHAARYSPDGSRLALVSDISEVIIIDSETSAVIHTLSGLVSKAQSLAWNPEGTRLATSGLVGDIHIWDANTGELLQNIDAHYTDLIPSLDFSADGRRLASIGWDNIAMIWDPNDGALVASVVSPPTPYKVTFGPEEGLLAVSGGEGTIDIWDVTGPNTTQLASIAGHSVEVPGLAFSPDGTLLVSGSIDGTARIWDVASSIATGTARELLILSSHEGGITDLSFSPDGSRLATSSQDGTVKITIMDFDELAALARSRLTRGFTEAECQQYLHLESCPQNP